MAGAEVSPIPGTSAPVNTSADLIPAEVPPAQAKAAEVPIAPAPQDAQAAELPPESEEKTSRGEEKTSGPDAAEVPGGDYTGEKIDTYNGKGRRHTDAQIDEILDWFILTGELPLYVSARQRLDYRKHPRLEVRRLYLQNAGLITKLSKLIRDGKNEV